VRHPIRVLCIGGHPADTFDSAGGTLAHHVQNGDEVTVVALTAGTRVHDVVISDALRFADRIPDAPDLTALMAERAQVKEEEVRRACAFLGITPAREVDGKPVLSIREDVELLRAVPTGAPSSSSSRPTTAPTTNPSRVFQPAGAGGSPQASPFSRMKSVSPSGTPVQ